MSQLEDEFLRRLRATFKVEAEEHTQALAAGLVALENSASGSAVESETVEAVFRHAHSLKGAARATNFSHIESVCQALESVFALWKARQLVPTAEHFDALHQAVDAIGRLIHAPDGTPPSASLTALHETIHRLNVIAGRASAAATIAAPRPTVAPEVVAAPSTETGTREHTLPRPAAVPANESVRIPGERLDRLLLQVEEFISLKQGATERAALLQEFGPQLELWHARWRGLQPALRSLRNQETTPEHERLVQFLEWNFDYMRKLETKLRLVGKRAALDRYELGKRIDELLSESKSLVMLPFSHLADLFPKLVRDLGRDQQKQVELTLEGTEIEIDKRILEEMKDPLIHLLRNCVDHGVEKPEERTKAGKPSRARISVSLATLNGDKVEIVVTDDGRGINVSRVKEAAVRRGLLSAQEAETLSDDDARDLIFRSDVSTSPIITEISGRGLGLAIVREKTTKLGGTVSAQSRVGGGTTFRLTLPLTMATFRGVIVRTGGLNLVIPTAQVERVARVKRSDIRTVENRETISDNERAVALVRLRDILELRQPEPPALAAQSHLSVVIIGTQAATVAFAVDEVLHEEEVLVKSFSRPLSRVRNLAGATVLGSGALALILNTADLLKSARRAGSPTKSLSAPPVALEETSAKSVLVAEDSITSRMFLKNILESAGYRVTTAVDGVDAWATLRTESFDLVVSDVEMPRLNGFDLTARIRADEKLASLPVVLVTALATPTDRERGIDVGASAYITKSSFDQTNLLEVIRRLA